MVLYTPDKQTERLQTIQYLLFAYNFVFFLIGCALLGVGIWMTVDGSYLSTIVGSSLYAAAAYMVVIAGGIIFFIAFLGCCGAATQNRCLLWTFFIILVVLFLVLFLAGILGIVFRSQLGDAIKTTMASTLKDHYGVDFHSDYNRAVTYAWDKAQEKLYCCAVEDEGWAIYRDSKWYEKFGPLWEDDVDGKKLGHEDQKPYVPMSCCVKDRFWRFINPNVCQKWRLGPPGSPGDGAINRALYYDGCYEAGKTYIMQHADIIIGLGVTFAIFMILGILGSFWLIRNLPKEREPEEDSATRRRQEYDEDYNYNDPQPEVKDPDMYDDLGNPLDRHGRPLSSDGDNMQPYVDQGGYPRDEKPPL